MQSPPSSSSAAKPVIVVVEDDPSIGMGLQINLEKDGYLVTVATDGELGLQSIRDLSPDLVILDVMLPQRNGFDILHTIRKEGLTMPVIMLSAKASEVDKVSGLELGAEDYVSKPFSLAELLARVRATLRRARMGQKTQLLAFGEVTIDIDAREVKRNGASVEFTQTEFDVLLCLVEAPGKALSREDIFRRVWGERHHGTPRTVDNFVQQLRSKLEIDPQEPKHFHTVRGIGYRFDR